MSFAQGFAAGSAAAQRGVDMGLAMKQRREKEEYQQKMQALQSEYDAGLQVQKNYQEAGQAALDAGYALASPATPSGPEALLGGLVPGQQSAQMSPVAPQGGGLGAAAGAPQGVMMEQPQAPSYQDYQRNMAALAMQYGDTATGISLMNQAAAADRNAQLDAMRQSEFQQDYLLRSNQDARQEAEAGRAALAADNEAKALEGKSKIDALINQGVTDRGQFDDILSEYGKYGVNVAYLGEALEASRGITRGQIEAEALQIQGDLRGITTFESLVDYYNESDSLSPGYKLELARNEETGLFDLNHFDDKGNKIDRDVASFRTKQEADVYLRQLAVDPTTAMKSLVERDNARRTAAAEAALEEAKLAVEKYGDDMGYKKEELKAVAAGIKGLRDDKTFFMLDPAERDARIVGVYESLDLQPPTALGLKPVEDKAPPPVLGAGAQAIEDAKAARVEAEKEQRTVASEADRIMDQRVRGPFGLMGDQELYDIGYNAATPEVRAEIDRILKDRERRSRDREAGGRLGLGIGSI